MGSDCYLCIWLRQVIIEVAVGLVVIVLGSIGSAPTLRAVKGGHESLTKYVTRRVVFLGILGGSVQSCSNIALFNTGRRIRWAPHLTSTFSLIGDKHFVQDTQA